MKGALGLGDKNKANWLKQKRERLFQNFVDQESENKTRKDDAKDASDWVSQFARLSKGVTEPGPQRDNFDAITPMKLRSFKTKNPKDAVMQIILNQMGHNPLEAVRLFETHEAQKKEELSLVMSNIAKNLDLGHGKYILKPLRNLCQESLTLHRRSYSKDLRTIKITRLEMI